MVTKNNELSERELEILRLVSTGASNKEIAQKLFISSNTVKTHIRNIFTKIGVNSRTEAAMYAVNSGLIPGIQSSAETEKSNDISKRRTRQRLIWGILGLFLMTVVIAIIGGVILFRRSANETTALPTEVNNSSRWKSLTSMPTGRKGLALAVYDDWVYAIAGEAVGGITNIVERYDVNKDQWIEVSSKPTPVSDVIAGVLGGKIFIPGGLMASGEMTDVLEIYNPVLDNWEIGAPVPIRVGGYGLATLEGKLYLFGGRNQEEYLSSVYEYDPILNLWNERTPMPLPQADMGALSVADRIYIIGGRNGDIILDKNYQYSPHAEGTGENPWFISAPMPEARYNMGIANLVDTIYIIGGKGEMDDVGLSQMRYDPKLKIWEIEQTQISESWSQGGVVVVGPVLHTLGGMLNDKISSDHFAYQVIYFIHVPIIQ